MMVEGSHIAVSELVPVGMILVGAESVVVGKELSIEDATADVGDTVDAVATAVPLLSARDVDNGKLLVKVVDPAAEDPGAVVSVELTLDTSVAEEISALPDEVAASVPFTVALVGSTVTDAAAEETVVDPVPAVLVARDPDPAAVEVGTTIDPVSEANVLVAALDPAAELTEPLTV
jgi:hypothetical protein